MVVLDRGRLAKIDRRVLAELNHADGVQAVKVPVSEAVWSTWRRYCQAMQLSMGDGVAGLILKELETVVDVDSANGEVFAERATQQAEEQISQLEARQHELDTRAETLKRKEEHLMAWEKRLRTPRVVSGQTIMTERVGRNERCPCGSGLKYKHCHGLPGRSD